MRVSKIQTSYKRQVKIPKVGARFSFVPLLVLEKVSLGTRIDPTLPMENLDMGVTWPLF